MADQTPKKTLTSHVCRCCNCSFQNNPIDLFCANSESEQLSPSVTEQRQQKRGKHDGHDDNERSRVRQCLQLQPAAIQPKECRDQLPESAARILPEFLQP